MARELATARRGDQPAGELARQLVQELCVARLLGHLFPAGPELSERQGRHRVLADVVAHSPELHRALLDQEEDAIQKAWTACLARHGTDVRLHHALAVLYRERALAGPAGADDDGLLVFATALWALLLGTKEFWARASENVVRWQADLLATLARELFTRHATAGRRALAEGRVKAAEPHLRCLVAGQSGAEVLVRILVDFGLPYRHAVDEELLGQVGSVAREVLGDWCAEVIRTARKAVEDRKAIAELPEGISRNWAGGIDELEPFVRVGVPVKEVLRTGLEWYVEWWFALNRREERELIRELLTPAARFADALIPLCAKGQAHKTENQVLSRYFMIRGFASADAAEQKSAQDEALEWNPNNENARELRIDMQIGGLLDRAFAAIDAKDIAEAIAQLRPALTFADDPVGRARIQKRIAPAYNAAGVAALNAVTPARDKLGTALTQVLEAVKLILPGASSLSSVPNLSSSVHSRTAPGCAVCDGAKSPRRRIVVLTLVNEVVTTGKFEASAVAFWRMHENVLCDGCRRALADIAEAKTTARGLFEESLRMDPDGTDALANLRTIDEMED